MSLSDLAALGSFVSGLAVLASLVFLFLQMRQMAEQARQSLLNQQSLMLQERTGRTIENLIRQSEPHLRDLLPRGRAGDVSLSPGDINAFLSVTYGGFINFENTFLQHAAGTIDPSIWPASQARLSDFLNAPGIHAAWSVMRHRFGAGYAAEVDRLIAHPPESESNLSNQVEQWKAAVIAERGG
jgi:hypothetical protein